MLKQFPNLKYISRDGSKLYKLAIELANPNIIHISDRFHLISSLSDILKNEIRKALPRIITLEEIKVDNSKSSIKKRFESARDEINNGASLSRACFNNDIDHRLFKKILNFNELEYIEYFKDREFEERVARIDSKNDLISKVKKLWKSGLSQIEIAKQIGINRHTVRKYIDLDYKITLESTSKGRNECVTYHNQIVKLLTKKLKRKFIYEVIRKEGYKSSYRLLSEYITRLKKSDTITYKKTIQRKYVVNLIYKKLTENKNLDKEMLLIIYKKYPQVKKLIELMLEFKGILLKTKSKKALDNWFIKAYKLNIKDLNSFINGCKYDYDAICNALKYKYSNGVVEASVNKIKLVKRIMFGRCSFELLRSKTLRLEFL